MPLPIVAVVGRPNVGKSTLVNRLSGEQYAIVFDEPGVTRDRVYRDCFWGAHEFQVVDTGGLVFDDETEFLPMIREQAEIAIRESVAVIFVVDGLAGITDADEQLGGWLRRQNIPVLLAVNKCEGSKLGLSLAAEFWNLGLGEPIPMSGIHGNGTGELLDELIKHLPPPEEVVKETDEIKVAIIGRPNVGKSSLLNAFIGENRSIVSPISGTTRDAIDMSVERDGKKYRLIDTAGVRRKKNIDYGIEFFSINRAFKAIGRSDVVLLVIDALDGVTDQDQKLAGRIGDEGKACVIVINKWDAIEKDSYTIYDYTAEVKSRLLFIDYAPIIFVSALTGQRVTQILDRIDIAAEQHKRRVPTAILNEALSEAVTWHAPPTSRGGKQGKVYYCTQISDSPPTVILFVNDPHRFNDNYKRYIENQFRKTLGFEGTPLRFIWRGKKDREIEKSKNSALR
ncbi:MAG: ribosome biogenesis GTPase Der [Pseudanabaena sp. CAN_BIN31]|nr:ribosome biogenesis GTPase Der [Pseudanabaena sp. CAN_BIN31]